MKISPSPELLAISKRFFNGIFTRQTSTLKDYLLDSDVLRFIGSAEGEYFSGRAVREAISDYFLELPTILEIEEFEAEAYENGETGWFAGVHRVKFEGVEKSAVFRTTLIFVLDGASWKIVLRNSSIGTDNVEVTGSEQAAIRNLLDAAQKGFSLDQREGLATIMFTDVVSSSALAEAMGDAAWSARIAAHFAEVRRQVEAGGGQLVKSLGDGTMSSFPSVRAALKTAQGIRAAAQADMSEPVLTLRIGLHTGDVVQTRDDFFGSVVNKAARIASAARPGQIALSEATRAMVGTTSDFAFSGPDTISLRGFEGNHNIFQLQAGP